MCSGLPLLMVAYRSMPLFRHAIPNLRRVAAGYFIVAQHDGRTRRQMVQLAVDRLLRGA
jgi:hypothetical protein